ncbi:MAG: glycoside hydrolase family 9 protein [Lachnospiraceae bacterium]|nr:glycoside hydrolase family 9 protein [Lachnospiraceae bacterium]
MHKISLAVIAICFAVFMAGCISFNPGYGSQYDQADTLNDENDAKDSDDPEEVDPETLINNINFTVRINNTGYEPLSTKTAVVEAESDIGDIQEELKFEICESETGDPVYKNNVRNGKYADFTDFDKEGIYYIEIGDDRSEEFAIKKGNYNNLLTSVILRNDIPVSIDTVEDMIFCCELAADHITAFELFEKETLDTTQNIKPKTVERAEKAVKSLIALYDTEENKILMDMDKRSELLYSAVLAKFSGSCSQYDGELSGDCLKIAKKVYREACKEEIEETDNDALYWASAELYRACGEKGYKNKTEELIQKEIYSGFSMTECGYYGSLSYLMTTYKVDMELSKLVMQAIIDDSIKLSNKRIMDIYNGNKGQEDVEEEYIDSVLSDIRLLMLANHISESLVYIDTAQICYDHLAGLNPQGCDYIIDKESEFSDKSKAFILFGFINSYIAERD